MYNVFIQFKKNIYDIINNDMRDFQEFVVLTSYQDVHIDIGGIQPTLIFYEISGTIICHDRSNIQSIYYIKKDEE